MRIYLSGRKFTFPLQCACCGGTPETTLTVICGKSTGKRVIHTKVNTWDFPYCTQCIDHIRIAKNASVGMVLITVVSVIVAVYFGQFTAVSTYAWIIVAAGSAGGFCVYNNLMHKARRNLNCVSTGNAVAYLGWHASCHEFEVISRNYALAFMLANEAKLVNMTPDTWGWLQANRHGEKSDQQQSARRFQL